jgi:hypothetical protein
MPVDRCAGIVEEHLPRLAAKLTERRLDAVDPADCR